MHVYKGLGAMKLVYCIACDVTNPWVNMARLSIATARHTNPLRSVELMVDRHSHDVLTRDRSRLLDEVDRTHICDTLPAAPQVRIRQRKCSVRRLTGAPILCIDSDTVLRGYLQQP